MHQTSVPNSTNAYDWPEDMVLQDVKLILYEADIVSIQTPSALPVRLLISNHDPNTGFHLTPINDDTVELYFRYIHARACVSVRSTGSHFPSSGFDVFTVHIRLR